jgi:hypothetical protein
VQDVVHGGQGKTVGGRLSKSALSGGRREYSAVRDGNRGTKKERISNERERKAKGHLEEGFGIGGHRR